MKNGVRKFSIESCKQFLQENKKIGKTSKKAIKKALTTETPQRIYMNMTF